MKTDWQHIPFSPKSWPFFYGWVIVLMSILGTIASIPGQTMGVGVFTDFLIETLGLSRVQLSMAYMFGTITSSFLLPFAGALLDRTGARLMGVLSCLGLGLSVALLSRADVIAMTGRYDSVILSMIAVYGVFLMLRFFGQGCVTMVARVMLGKWFNHRRGIAAAICALFISFAFNGSPRFLDMLTGAFGWRGACLILAVITGGGMSLIALIFYRDNPEACGLTMDGNDDPAWHEKMTKRRPETHHEFTRKESLRTAAFWVFSFAMASQSLMITAITFHIASIGGEMGLDRAQAYAVFFPMAFFGVSANFTGGWLSDRIRLKYLLFVMMTAQAMGTAGLLFLGETPGWWLFVSGYGVSGGLFGLMTTVVWPRFYGRRHLGAISGLNTSIMVFASAIGPVLFSAMRGVTGSYQMAVFLCWFLPAALLIAGLFADNPQNRFADRQAAG
jgi:MFS transporter, OFA family, oxalate/formate antiporter